MGVIASIAMLAGGCGSHERAPQATKAERSKADTPYVEALLGFRDSARLNAGYDAYGSTKYLPDAQRAAIGAFCRVVSKPKTSVEREKLANARYLSSRVDAAVGSEARGASAAAIRRAVHKLQTVIEADPLTPSLVKSYANACY